MQTCMLEVAVPSHPFLANKFTKLEANGLGMTNIREALAQTGNSATFTCDVIFPSISAAKLSPGKEE